ncbi:MAG: DsbA family oxidoreductase [Ilumatobacteraceae bacterium]
MLIEVWSDVVCPWCYIGKRKLELALSQYEGPEPEVRYRAFQLDPRAPHGPGMPVREAYAKKFGGEEAADRILQRVTEAAAEVGLGFRLDRAIRANTLDAHRLLALALEEGVQRQLKEELLQAYFVDGQDIGASSTLVERGVSAGLAEDRIREWLDGPGGLDRVRRSRRGRTA